MQEVQSSVRAPTLLMETTSLVTTRTLQRRIVAAAAVKLDVMVLVVLTASPEVQNPRGSSTTAKKIPVNSSDSVFVRLQIKLNIRSKSTTAVNADAAVFEVVAVAVDLTTTTTATTRTTVP